MATVYDYDFFADECMSVYLIENGRYGVWTPSDAGYFFDHFAHSISKANVINQLQMIVDYENIHILDRPFIEDKDPVLQALYANSSLGRGESKLIPPMSPFYKAINLNSVFFMQKLEQVVIDESLHDEIEILPNNNILVSCRLRDRFSHKNEDFLAKFRKKFHDAYIDKKKSRRQQFFR